MCPYPRVVVGLVNKDSLRPTLNDSTPVEILDRNLSRMESRDLLDRHES